MLGPYDWQGELTTSYRNKPTTTEPVLWTGKSWNEANDAINNLIAQRLSGRGVRRVHIDIVTTSLGVYLRLNIMEAK